MSTDISASVASMLDNPGWAEKAERVRKVITRDPWSDVTASRDVTVPIKVVTVPVSADDRALAPEGTREREMRKFWTRSTLISVVEGVADGDIVRYNSIDFQIVRVDTWGAFIEALGVRPES